ncbi:hypothetical protein BB560_006913, partial [Smittium megazygosporum]
MDNPNEDTEWNDILRKHGILPEKPKVITLNEVYDSMAEEKKRIEEEEKYADKELDELEDLLADDSVFE